MTTNDSYRKVEITFLADFLHHRFGKLSGFFFSTPIPGSITCAGSINVTQSFLYGSNGEEI